MHIIAQGLWLVLRPVLGWFFRASGISALLALVGRVLTPIFGRFATWVTVLLFGGTVGTVAYETGAVEWFLQQLYDKAVVFLLWVLDQGLTVAIWAASVADAFLPPVSDTVGAMPSMAVEIAHASGMFHAVGVALAAALAVKLIRMLPFVK